MDIEGNSLGFYTIISVIDVKKRYTQLIKVQVPKAIARKIASFRIQLKEVSEPLPDAVIPDKMPDEAMICLCERVKAGDIRKLIHSGVTNLNQIKAITRAGMGPCGAKTCENLILQLLREEGIPIETVVPNTKRPLFIEVPLEKFPDGD